MKLEEVKELVSILGDLLSFFKDTGDDPSEIESCKVALSIFEDVVKNGQDSEHFTIVNSFQIQLDTSSQSRSVTIEPDHVRILENSIEARKKILEPVLLLGGTRPGFYDIENGIHRWTALGNLQKKGVFDKSFPIPAIVIPYRLKSKIINVLHTAQMILNEGKIKKTSTEHDVKKYMYNETTRLGYNLTEEKDYNRMLQKCSIIFRNKTKQSLRSLLTRVKNQKVGEQSDVHHGSATDFKKMYIEAHDLKKTKPVKIRSKNVVTYNNREILHLLSTKGGNDSKAHNAALNCRYETDKAQVGLVVCQDSGGMSAAVIESRKTIFNNLFYNYLRNEKLCPGSAASLMPFDKIVVLPQNIADFQYDGNLCQRENIADKNCYIKVSREEILDCFQSGMPYKEEWLYAKRKSLQQEAA